MKTIVTAGAVAVLLLAGCVKEKPLTKPAVQVRVYSASYPPSADNGYFQYTATVQLRKRDGSYSAERKVTGTGTCEFEDLRPGDYWINETLTRHSSDIRVRAGEVTEFTFTVP